MISNCVKRGNVEHCSISVISCVFIHRALFVRHSTHDKIVYDIPGLSSAMMELIVEFAYTSSVHVTENNVQDLCQAADQFDITAILQRCCNFLVERLCPDNCIGIWKFTDICFCPELKHKACNYIMNHFEEVVATEEFQMLSVQELSYILERDELNAMQESTVYEAVLHWISHSPEERNTHFALLLSKVYLLTYIL